MAQDDTSSTAEPVGNMIPETRFKAVAAKHRDALARVAELEAQLADADKRASVADKLATQIDTLKGELETTRATAERRIALADAGISDHEARTYLESRYAATDSPGDFPSWLTSQREAAAADGASPLLRAIFPGAAPAPAEELAAEPATTRRGIDTRSTVTHHRPTDSRLSIDRILDRNTPHSDIFGNGVSVSASDMFGPLARRSSGE